MTELSCKVVEEIFMDCLLREKEDTTGHILAEGIVVNVGFHPGRVEAHKEEIISLLNQLPEAFFKGGHSFLAACNNREGNQWGEHRQMEMLFQLGIGIGRVTCLLPRHMWSLLPGGMPYYAVSGE